MGSVYDLVANYRRVRMSRGKAFRAGRLKQHQEMSERIAELESENAALTTALAEAKAEHVRLQKENAKYQVVALSGEIELAEAQAERATLREQMEDDEWVFFDATRTFQKSLSRLTWRTEVRKARAPSRGTEEE